MSHTTIIFHLHCSHLMTKKKKEFHPSKHPKYEASFMIPLLAVFCWSPDTLHMVLKQGVTILMWYTRRSWFIPRFLRQRLPPCLWLRNLCCTSIPFWAVSVGRRATIHSWVWHMLQPGQVNQLMICKLFFTLSEHNLTQSHKEEEDNIYLVIQPTLLLCLRRYELWYFVQASFTISQHT